MKPQSSPLPTSAPAVTNASSAADKVALFRKLFAGRTDVFPTRWENPKSGRAGYAPACGNEWVRGVCGKPQVRCGECPNQSFVPVTDEVIESHLRGEDRIRHNGQEARIDLPGERTKNGLPHIVPLSTHALALLPALRDGNEMLFGRRVGKGFSGWSKAKVELDAAILKARRKVDPKAKPMPHWVVHDLRRTFVTLMGERGIAPPHIVEAIVNHVSGHKAGVAGVYNKAIYLEERRQALDAWGRYVEGLIHGTA